MVKAKVEHGTYNPVKHFITGSMVGALAASPFSDVKTTLLWGGVVGGINAIRAYGPHAAAEARGYEEVSANPSAFQLGGAVSGAGAGAVVAKLLQGDQHQLHPMGIIGAAALVGVGAVAGSYLQRNEEISKLQNLMPDQQQLQQNFATVIPQQDQFIVVNEPVQQNLMGSQMSSVNAMPANNLSGSYDYHQTVQNGQQQIIEQMNNQNANIGKHTGALANSGVPALGGGLVT